nr:hypothetical protein [Desulfobacterales bacterium]
MAGSDIKTIDGRLAWLCLFFIAILYVIPSDASANSGSAYTHLNEVMDAYESISSNEPRFLASYITIPQQSSDRSLEDVAYVYDNALAMICYIHQKTADGQRRARILADSF